ncbi:hypothetical protein FB45DRAFT_1057177 [Roridomyces roridus]|uniref:F-box domain-containing protein n=1 Tax=Roridomyces roridus TaxID=1738132 RepID=A0AAD7FSE9_9AGAR|nr:hypothetical protein FB45DRAFT_1057177 [Roridomyces roridus]
MSLSDHAEIRAHLTAIQAKILAFESQLAVLHAEERAVRATLVYPVDTLPTDVIIEIFQNYTGDPMVVASVCRQWWEAALSCPRLWPALPDTPPSNTQVLANLLRTRLARVGSLPLRIDMMDDDAAFDRGDTLLSGSLLSPATQSEAERICAAQLSIKRKPYPARDSRIVLPSAPHLTDVRLSNVKASQISLPWSQLTALSLSEQSLLDGLVIIQLTPNLFTLRTRLAGIHGRPPTVIDLPHLRILSTSFTAILEAIKAPALEDLSIHHFTGETASVLRNFAARSGCAIHKLRLRCPSEANPNGLRDSVNCTQILPILRDFTLSGIKATSSRWQTFFREIATRTIFPDIESWTFTDCAISIGYIADMLAERARGKEGKIKSFTYIPGEDEDPERSLATLEELRSQGLEINIGWGKLD